MNRLPIDPRGVSHNPSTLVARTIHELRAYGVEEEANLLLHLFGMPDGTLNVSVENSDGWTEQDWMVYLESVVPVRYTDQACDPRWFGILDQFHHDDHHDDHHVHVCMYSTVFPDGKLHFNKLLSELRPLVADLEASTLWVVGFADYVAEGDKPWWNRDEARAGV